MFESLWADVRYAFRSLRRSRGFTLTTVLTLALGSGVNIAIFSIFNQALLRELPVPAPEQLVNLSSPGRRSGRTSTSGTFGRDATFSYPLFRDLERDQHVFTGLAAHRDFVAHVAFQGRASSEAAQLVSGSYFTVLGLRPALGRLLGPDDDRARDAHYVVVLSHEYWRTRFNTDPAVLNNSLVINGQAMTIVGVTPREFTSTTLENRPRVFVPLSMAALMMPGVGNPHASGPWNGFEDRRDHWLYLFGRLKPGISREAAETAMNGVFASIMRNIEIPALRGFESEAMHGEFRNRRLFLERGSQGQRPERGELGRVLLLLFCVTGIVLLIACANVANLLLARAASRSTDLTIRLAIGASRARVVRYLLIESSLLAAVGGICGVAIAAWTLSAIVSLMPAFAVTILTFELDFTMLCYSAALSAAVLLLFGLYPALHSTRRDLVSALKSGSTMSASRSAARFRTSLATAQIALSMSLLVVAGLFARSLFNMSRVDLGIEAEQVATFRLSPELNGYTAEHSGVLFDRVAAELVTVPGVSSVTAATVPLLAGVNSGTNVTVEGFNAPPDTDTGTVYSRIGSGYFRTLGIPLIAGREFTEADVIGSPKVAIVNESFARRFNLWRNPIGKRMYLGAGRPPDTEIVGFVQDAKYSQLKAPPPPQFFIPYRQVDPPGTLNFYVRSTVPAERIVSTIPPIVARVDGTLPVENLQLMTTQAQATVVLDRLIGVLAAAFAGLATLLAAVGLFGVLSYTVARRTREIGLRMALGADARRVQRMVFGSLGWMTLVGGAAGVAAAIGLGRLAQSLLFGVEGVDPLVTACAAAGLATVAIGAGVIPARRAARVNPIVALRTE